MPPLARPKTVARISPKLRARAQRAAREAGEIEGYRSSERGRGFFAPAGPPRSCSRARFARLLASDTGPPLRARKTPSHARCCRKLRRDGSRPRVPPPELLTRALRALARFRHRPPLRARKPPPALAGAEKGSWESCCIDAKLASRARGRLRRWSAGVGSSRAVSSTRVPRWRRGARRAGAARVAGSGV